MHGCAWKSSGFRVVLHSTIYLIRLRISTLDRKIAVVVLLVKANRIVFGVVLFNMSYN